MAISRDDFVRRLSLGGVIVATAVISYTILRDRAINIGFVDWWTAWLYPIGLDALIIGASRVWGQKDISPGTRRMAMVMTLAAIGAGIAAFVVEFYSKGWVAVGFACLIPASLAASLVLTSRVAADRRDGYAPPSKQPVVEDVEDVKDHVEVDWLPREHETYEIANSLLDQIEPYPESEQATKSYVDAQASRVAYEDVPVVHEDVPSSINDDETDVERTMFIPIVSARGPRPQPEPEPLNRAVLINRQGDSVSADVRKTWVRDRLAQDIETTGADVDKQFPEGSRNGARIVRQVREQMVREQREQSK